MDARRKAPSGFTLIEILVVLSLLGVLMGLSIGFVQRAGKGNLLLQTSNSLANLLASARAQSFGSARAYVSLTPGLDGLVQVRSFRNRQVFHWPCEDLEKASEPDMIRASGGVDVSEGDAITTEGRYCVFGKGGSVSLGTPPWLQFVDGMALQCRVRPALGAGGSMNLFKMGAEISVRLVTAGDGRFDVEAKIRLAKDDKGEGDGPYEIRTGFHGAKDVPEWRGPVIPGRWHEIRVAYDRNLFSIHIDDKVRAIGDARRNKMHASSADFVIGGGYEGDFDSLVISGIFEDDDDRYDIPDSVKWLGDDGKPNKLTEFIHFRNRGLDPRFHTKPVRLVFQLDSGDESGRGAKRVVTVALSGETFVRRPDEE